MTGHTLYNDSSVAIRELVQNSIDAVRLQSSIKKTDSRDAGKISITWNSADLTLTIVDNGTGMTQDIIERHLLNVGSSRYQDPKFKERHPDFSPISRFGIGVLSTFMVADNVQIITFHEDQDEGRQISLRSVHGKYLIRLLDKRTSAEVKEIGPHGTKIILKMRSSSRRVDVLETLRRWIMFPRCNVIAQIDQNPSEIIGFQSPKEALTSYLATAQLGLKPELIRVKERTIGDDTLAFVMLYNSHFRDHKFLQHSENTNRHQKLAPVGVCVEGIRVDFNSPGFPTRSGLLSIVDCKGKDAPKTNVARSALESEAEQTNLVSSVFGAYLEEVSEEITRLQNSERYSLGYAIEQFPFIAGPLYGHAEFERVRESFRNFPMIMLENEANTRAVSVAELHTLDGFWTVESASMDSLIRLLKDTTATVTCKQVAKFAGFKGAPLPDGSLITNSYISSLPRSFLESEFEICELRVSLEDRRIDAKWSSLRPEKPRWINSRDIEQEAALELREELQRFRRVRDQGARRYQNMQIATDSPDLVQTGLENYFAVVVTNTTRILPGTPMGKFLASLNFKSSPFPILLYLDALNAFLESGSGLDRKIAKAEIEYALKESANRFDQHKDIDTASFLDALSQTENKLLIFDPWSWERTEGNDSSF